MGKIVTVTSGKGGTGKTTTVAALSSCLAALGYKTLCIDFDVGMGNLDLALGMEDFSVIDFSDVLSEEVELSNAVSESPHIPNLFFLSAPTDCEFEETDRAPIMKMFAEIRETFDYCLIDSPPGIGIGFALAHCGADMSVIVTTGELPAMRDATRAAGTLRDMEIDNLRLLVNKVNEGNLRHIRTTVDDIVDTTGVRLIGLIPEDKSVFRSLHESVPLALYYKRKAVYDFLDAARRITGKEISLRQY